MKTNMRGKDFITLMHYSKEEMETIVETALDLKRQSARGECNSNILSGKSLGMLFLQPSTRTRISFESGMTQLGGHAQFYSPEHLQLKNKESWEDTAKVMSRYLDGLVLRTFDTGEYGTGRDIINTFADNADIPVISAADDKEHPCQVLGDILTVREKFGTDFCNKKFVMTWVNANKIKNRGIPQCIVIAAAKLGMKLTFAFPEGYEIDPEYWEYGQMEARTSGATIEIVRNLEDALKDAHVIYAKSFGSHTLSKKDDADLRGSLKDWCIKPDHFRIADRNAIFMHCLPIERNVEATDDVVDGPHSIVYDQAENRLHIQKAIMSVVMR
jgi:ornithine carbamoyltransferase